MITQAHSTENDRARWRLLAKRMAMEVEPPFDIRERALQLAVMVVEFVEGLSPGIAARGLGRQLVRSGTSSERMSRKRMPLSPSGIASASSSTLCEERAVRVDLALLGIELVPPLLSHLQVDAKVEARVWIGVQDAPQPRCYARKVKVAASPWPRTAPFRRGAAGPDVKGVEVDAGVSVQPGDRGVLIALVGGRPGPHVARKDRHAVQKGRRTVRPHLYGEFLSPSSGR